MIFQELTDFLDKVEHGEYGIWMVNCENDGSQEYPIKMQYVNYGEAEVAFERAVYSFSDEHSEYEIITMEPL